MGRAKTIIAGSYAALLVVIAALGVVVWRQRRRARCIPIPEVPEGVRKQIFGVAARAADAADEVTSLASRATAGAKSVAEKATKILR